MNPNTKSVNAILSTGATNGATVTAAIDRLGYDHMSLDVVAGTANVVSNTFTTLKLSESDITDATGYSDIAAFTGGGDDGFTIGNQLTNALNVYRFDVDLRGRKRYLKVTASPQTTQAIIANARLSKAEQIPDSATDVGANVVVRG
jgi:hypothetical protein